MAKRRSSTSSFFTYEERIRQLESDLYMARSAIIDLMSEPAQDILRSFNGAKSKVELYRWLDDAARRITDLAIARPAVEMSDYSSTTPRAVCPLCGDGSSNPFGVKGFAVSEGLLRHLLGRHNSNQCSVFSAAQRMALEYRNTLPD